MAQKRLDILLVEKGLVPTRAKARGMILAGEVYVDGKRSDKAGQLVNDEARIEIKRSAPDYVSRGGTKIAHALGEFKIDVHDFVCMDIGASTGGFTDCLLKNGAKRVYAIDVGYGQLDFSIRNNERVVVLEKTNIRNLDTGLIKDKIDLITIDVSFIGLAKVFPKVDEILNLPKACHSREPCHSCPPLSRRVNSGRDPEQKKSLDSRFRGNDTPLIIIALIKPQFEVGKGKVGKGGVVRDEDLRQEVIESVKVAADKFEWQFKGFTTSPIKGPKGNVEYLAYWIKNPFILRI